MKSIFVSSTSRDLINERDIAIETIDGLDSAKAVAMERFPSNPHPSKDVCLSHLRECDLVILVLGYKYGSEDPEENISITEIEYNEAKSLDLPVLVFLKTDDKGNWVPHEEPEKKEKLENFKKRLDSEITRETFQEPEELGRKIAIAIYNYESEYGEVGIHNRQLLTGDQFFKPYLCNQKIFNHCHDFLGRKEIFQTAYEFIGSTKRILMIHGRGGIGKSKLLYELQNKIVSEQQYKVWFLRENAQLSEDLYREIPLKRKNIIIIDDAHRQNDLRMLFQIAIDSPDSIQLIFSLRNYGLNSLKAQSLQNGFEPSDIEILPEITDLKREDMEALADSILDNDHKNFRDALVNVARDSPLVLVIGARLVNENSILPQLLSKDKDFRAIVFEKFSDILIGDLSNKFDKSDVKHVLRLFSALQPVDLNDTTLDKISEFIGIEKYELNLIISELESAGVLLKKGRAGLRITPDVFSDYILSEVCVTQDRLTGYADKVFDAFYDTFPAQIISNIAELDWRVQCNGTKIDVMNHIWEKIFNDYKQGSNLDRHKILTIIEKIAYLQPSKSFEIIEFALTHPSSEDEGISGLYVFTHEDIISDIPGILKKISYNIQYLPQCCDILWDLGKDQEGDLNPDTNPPISILQDLAQYRLHKPTVIQSILLDAVEKWLRDPSSHNHLHSPLDIIDPILKKDGEDSRFTGSKFEFTSFAISNHKTLKIRRKALDLISTSFAIESTRVRVRAIKSLMDALRPPRPLFGREISEEEYVEWYAEEKEILNIFEKITSEIRDPVVRIEIRQNLHWYARFGRDEENLKKAKNIIKKIRETFDVRLVRALRYSFDERERGDYKKTTEAIDRNIQDTIKKLISKQKSPDAAYSMLNDTIRNFELERISYNPGRFFYLLGKLDPKYSEKICLNIISDSSSSLCQYYGSIISGIIESNKNIAKYHIEEGLHSQRIPICRSIAFGYSNGWWQGRIEKGELQTVEGLLKCSDGYVRKYAIATLAEFPRSENRKIKTIALNLDLGENISFADELFKLFFSTTNKPALKLTKSEIEKMIMKLKPMPSLERNANGSGFYVCNFFKYASEKNPDAIISLFFERIKYGEEIREKSWNSYDPIPSIIHSDWLEQFYIHPDYQKLLKKVRDEAYNAENKWRYGCLFKLISNNYSAESLQSLAEWINSDSQRKILTVCDLIQHAPPEFLLANSDFVNKILESSSKIDTCHKKVKKTLHRIARCSGRTGTFGEPFPLDIKLRDGAKECAKKFSTGSVTEIFYHELAEEASRWVRDAITDDQEYFED